MASGTVKWFDPNRGYGFIRPEQGEDVFVHITVVQASGLPTLQDGQAVEFDIEPGRKGSPGHQPAARAGTPVGLRRRCRQPPGCVGSADAVPLLTCWWMRSEPASGAGSLVLLSGGPVGGMLMGKEAPLCGLPWPVCPLDLDQRLSSRAGTARCPVCYRRWPLDEVVPCPAGAGAAVGPGRHERVVCRSHAAHPSMARLVAIEEDSP